MQKYYFTLKGPKETYFDLPQHTQQKHFVSVKINMLKKNVGFALKFVL